MHKLLLGVEHLMTGVQIRCDGVLTFERESASVVRVLGDDKIEAYWPVKGTFISSQEVDQKPQPHNENEVQWWAQIMAASMRSVDSAVDAHGNVLPDAVVKAMRGKFGDAAGAWCTKLQKYGDYWGFTYAGMFHGVESDGYIHT